MGMIAGGRLPPLRFPVGMYSSKGSNDATLFL